jgi:hypothetical protein
MGAENCPGCGAVVDVDWEQRAHLYRARREVFGDLAEVLKAPSDYTTVVPVTEQQYLRFIDGSHVLSAGPVSRMTRTINSLDFSESSTIRGARTREAATVLYQDALKLRRLKATLKSMKPYGAFAQPHEHLIGAFEAYREHFRELAGALLARGPSEVEAHYGNTDATHTESPNFAEKAKHELRLLLGLPRAPANKPSKACQPPCRRLLGAGVPIIVTNYRNATDLRAYLRGAALRLG